MSGDRNDTAPGLYGGEGQAREVLEGSEHDTDLGLRVALDAQRVVAGELSEAEFRARYEGPFLEEFGVDDRPKLSEGLVQPENVAARFLAAGDVTGEASADGELGTSDTAGSVAADEDPDEPSVVSRRHVLGAVSGVAAGALFYGALFRNGAMNVPPEFGSGEVAAAGPTGAGAAGAASDVQFGMVIDLERCDGCLECVDACSSSNGLSEGSLWAYVMAYKEPEDVDPRFLVRLCQHCTNAPCVMVCPTGARHRRLADGLVLTDYDVCIGCRYCQVACPYGVNAFQWADPRAYGGSYSGQVRDSRGLPVAGDPPKGVMGKCTFCPIRQDDPEQRGSASCVEACNMGALYIGDLNDPDSAPNRYLAQRREQAGGNLPTFRLLEDLGTDPNIIYIGHPPSSKAELVDGPFSYEDWGLTDDRRSVLEGPEPWFRRATQEA